MGIVTALRGMLGQWRVNRFGLISPRVAATGTSTEATTYPLAGTGSSTADLALSSSAWWACCRLISQSVSALPGHIFAESGDGKAKAFDHPYYRLLTKQPNLLMSYTQWIQTTVLHLMIYGNAFTKPVLFDGSVMALYPLDPERMTVEVLPTGTVRYTYTDRNGKPDIFTSADVLHFRVFSLDGLIGLSPLDYQRMVIDAADASSLYALGAFRAGGRPSGVLEYPGMLKEEQVKDIRASWNSVHGGINSGNVAVLANGVKYAPVSVPLQQMEWIAHQKLTALQIAMIFGVPPHLIGAADKPTYASVEQQSVEFRQFTVQPLVTSMERTIENALLEPPFIYRINLAGFERGDIKTRYTAYATARQWGWMSANDIRELEDLNRIGEQGDVYLTPLNMANADVEKELTA